VDNHKVNLVPNLPENETESVNDSGSVVKNLLDNDLKMTKTELLDDKDFDWKAGIQK